MSRSFVTMLLVAISLLVVEQKGYAQPQQVPPPAFAASAFAPVANGANRWDITLNGTFTGLRAPLLVEFQIQAIDILTKTPKTIGICPTIIEGTVGNYPRTQVGVTRAVGSPDGGFTGFGHISTYTPLTHDYEMKIYYRSNNGALVATKNWFAIPK